ncbi:2-oxoglutarate-Fe(II)-dependent oxygenase superfamily protein [Cupriavidus metallidurans]|uniref:2OG-Fe(II) oxygenase n=1 Tax=Cupriavidus metallidurans TaxID=119219 RepID=UPI00068B5CC4|nr:2OG-Fe(II) oxygenase [Cupriavidus metallidurans]MDE4918531.1 2OG-Fe(II) oxygenase [Cupriavidus metallidurans]
MQQSATERTAVAEAGFENISLIDMGRLLREEYALTNEFSQQRPFRYLVIDNFLHPEQAERIFQSYPAINEGWQNGNGLHTKGKWGNPDVEGTVAGEFYREINSPEFRQFLGRVTGIENLLEDTRLQGAGLHQIREGGFLNVHIDFNRLDGSNLDRRLNLIVYMNPGWKEEFGGCLELWDMEKKVMVDKVIPTMNRCVVFETNEISYHGHPVPVQSGGTTRKSLSVYYYTDGRDDVVADTHNTVYVNTQGAEGSAKLLKNGLAHTARKFIKKIGGEGNF